MLMERVKFHFNCAACGCFYKAAIWSGIYAAAALQAILGPLWYPVSKASQAEAPGTTSRCQYHFKIPVTTILKR